MKYDNAKIKKLFNSIYHDTKTEKDEEYIVEYIKKIFGAGRYNADPSLLNQFNNLIVEQADEIAKPKVTDMIGLLADVKMRGINDNVQIKIPQKNRVRLVWSANGSGVDLHRVAGKKSILATPEKFSTGFYYEPNDFVSDSIGAFRDTVDKIAEAKVKLYFDEIAKVTATSLSGGKIPAANQLIASGITYANYNKLASTIMRYGGTPIFVADTLLIDHVASQMATEKASLLSDDTKDQLLTALAPTRLGRTIAVNLINPFTDETNTKVELPVDTGYMFAGGVNQKPFSVVEFGGMRQKTQQDLEDERVVMKLFQSASVLLMFGEALGYVEDDTVTL